MTTGYVPPPIWVRLSPITDKEIETMTETVKHPRPLNDRLLCRRVKAEEEKMIGHIVIPGVSIEAPQEADVLAVGHGRVENGVRVPMDVQPGDRILFGKYSGADVKLRDEEYLILREDEVLAVL